MAGAWAESCRGGGGRYCVRDLAERAGAGDPGQQRAPRRSGGGMRARRREGARWLLQLPLSLPLSLSLPLLLPPETARGACSSVDVRGGRAWLLLLPARSAEPGQPARKGGGAADSEAVGACVESPRIPWSGRGNAPSAEGGVGAPIPGTLRPAPAFRGSFSGCFLGSS